VKRPLKLLRGGLGSVILGFLTSLVGAEVQPAMIFVGDGDPVAYRPYSSVPSNWMTPDATLDWPVANSGFGPRSISPEVSSILDFSLIHLRGVFKVGSFMPTTLQLSLKHSGGAVTAYLNGDLVLEMEADEMPTADGFGFRSFDLTDHLGKLLSADDNLLALRVSGNYAIPILHGRVLPPFGYGAYLEFDVLKTRITEAGPGATVRITDGSFSGYSPEIYLSTKDGSPVDTHDFQIVHNGQIVPFQAGPTPYFSIPIPVGGRNAEFEVRAVSDDWAEAQTSMYLRTGANLQSSVGFVITRNGTTVTNTLSSGEGSLRLAIENANLLPGFQAVRFSDSESAPFSAAPITINLDPTGLGKHFDLSDELLIEGPSSPGRVTINANGINLFEARGTKVELRQLILRNANTALETIRYGGELIIEDCEFIGNTTALELYSLKTPIQIRRCLITGSSRNAIQNRYGLPPVLSNCTIASNTSETAISSSRSLLLDSCTIVHNQRAVSGNVIARNCLFTAHSGGIKLVNPTEFDAGGNLFEERSGASIFPLNPLSLSGTPESPLDPKLGELGFHGGFTRTIPILKTSPALDLGLPTSEGSPPYDQRGIGFARRAGPKPDAGAFEIQLTPSDLSLGAVTSVAYDEAAGIYFQLAVIHNNSLWDLTGFQITPYGLITGVSLYNGTATGELDVSGGIRAGGFRIVVLQYLADRSDLLIQPQIELGILPDSDLPASPSPSPQIMRIAFDENLPVSLNIPTKSGRNYEVEYSKDLKSWHSAGPIFWAESDHVEWRDSEPKSDAKYYRVKEMN